MKHSREGRQPLVYGVDVSDVDWLDPPAPKQRKQPKPRPAPVPKPQTTNLRRRR
jgi:hypothetical protein